MWEEASVMLSSLPPLSSAPEALVADEANNYSSNRIPPAPSSIDWEDDIIPLPPQEQSGLEILFHGRALSPECKQLSSIQASAPYRGFCSAWKFPY